MIDSFIGVYRFLSNFSPAAVRLDFNGVRVDGDTFVYPTVEHAFQAAKSNSLRARARIFGAPMPGTAKQLGRRLVLRDDWEANKLYVMSQLIAQKFPSLQLHDRYDYELTIKLLATGDEELLEGNDWNDRFWGVCDGVGENHLGKILMARRAQVREVRGAIDRLVEGGHP